MQQRAARVAVVGNRQFNPGWHLAIDLGPLLAVSECIARAALDRTESRGGHTRDDYPQTDPELGKVNVVVRRGADGFAVTREPLPVMPDELRALFEEGHGNA